MTAETAIPHLDTPDDELTVEQLREKYEPIKIGPTWMRNDDGSWCLPEKTLGWEIAGWCAENLNSLDDDAPEGAGFQFTLEQLRFVLWWYAVDERGEFVYRSGVLQRMKGWGKDPLLAVLCIVEFVGPCRFSHWDENGQPVAKQAPRALVQVAAVSADQTKNTMDLIPALMTDKLISTYGINPAIELIRADGGRVLQGVTSNYRALEGKRSTFVVLNETHHWVSGNNGHKMQETLDNNAAKMDGRWIAITNAYLPGEDSVAQRIREGFEKKLEVPGAHIDMMYDSLEAPAHTPLDPLILPTIIEMLRGDAVWLKPEAIISSILRGSGIGPARSRRMWLNQIVADEDALYSPADWDPLLIEGELHAGDEIVLGFDGGKSDDATVLVAIRVRDRLIQPLHIQEAKDGPEGENWQVNREAVDAAVHSAFRLFKVVGFYADVALWESYIHEWSRLYGDELRVQSDGRNAIAWDMRRSLERVTRAHEQFVSAVLEGHVHHNGDRTLRRHVLNVRRRENKYGVGFGKESRESKKKIDLYAGAMLAYTCLRDLETRGKEIKKQTRRGWFL